MIKKNNTTLRIGFVLAICMIVSLIALAFTFAKYVSTGIGTDNARVAKWGLNIPIDSDLKLFSDAYKSEGTPSAYDTSGNIVKSDTSGQRVIAPGTYNTVNVSLVADTAPEVMYDFDISLKIVDITTQSGTTQESLIQLLDNYPPWKWTLGDQEFDDFNSFELAVNNLSQKDIPPNHLPSMRNITLGWKWDFDDNGAGTYDTSDTYRGDKAVTDALTHLKVNLNVDAVQCQGGHGPTPPKTKVSKPKAVDGLVYNGEAQIGVNNNIAYYTLTAGPGVKQATIDSSGNATAVDAGTYPVIATLNSDQFEWEDGSSDPYNLSFSIALEPVPPGPEPPVFDFLTNLQCQLFNF